LDSYFDEFDMTDKEIWTLAGRYGEWLNGEVVQITDENVIKFVRAVQQAERGVIIRRCEEYGAWNDTAQYIADDIRMRGEK